MGRWSGSAPAGEAPWRLLLATAGAGAAIYVAVLALAWVVAGRPEGPERDLAALAGGVARKLRALRLSRPAAAVRAR